jgi:CO/xanthine dehydrogenase FAD-binding subunit
MSEMFARPGLPSFEYVKATNAKEVVSLLKEHGEGARLLMGGTDLFPNMRDGRLHPRIVVDLKRLPGMRDVTFRPGEGLVIGAAVTMNELATHPAVRTHYPLLAYAASSVASYQVRNRATLGGNLCNASPCADTSPATLVLEAAFSLQGPSGERSVPATEFFLAPGKTVLQPGEFMTAIRFPLTPTGAAAAYQKLGRCRSGDLSLVAVAVLGYPDSGSPSSYRFRIGLGSVAPTPLRARLAEAILGSHAPGKEIFVRAAEEAGSEAKPITDVRGTAEYQRDMVRTLTIRALDEVWAKLKEAD